MQKSIYSLVLMDDVIAAVDKEAYRLNTSRSNLINQILAEHLACVTPEMKMQEIFNSISDMLEGHFQIQQQNSNFLMTIKSALQYKYKPTVNYKVELFRNPNNYIGQIKVQIRSQSSTIIKLFEDFFKLWVQLEANILVNKIQSDYIFKLESGKFVRQLFNPKNISDNELGQALYSYINVLDKAIKLYFSAPSDFNSKLPLITKLYIKQTENCVL
ncbi:MAG: hypothetical protein SOW77_01205 [Ruminococcus sp.]|nr:hypothetical protein [Ruminococcus sp.]